MFGYDINGGYLFAAYALFFAGFLLYLASLVVRNRTVKRDEELIRQIEAEAQTTEK